MAPIQSYFGKAQVFKRYKEAYNTGFYKALTKELPVLVKLYDYIEQDLANKYNEYKKSLGFSHPHFGNVKGIEYMERGGKTGFLQKETMYMISSGYI